MANRGRHEARRQKESTSRARPLHPAERRDAPRPSWRDCPDLGRRPDFARHAPVRAGRRVSRFTSASGSARCRPAAANITSARRRSGRPLNGGSGVHYGMQPVIRQSEHERQRGRCFAAGRGSFVISGAQGGHRRAPVACERHSRARPVTPAQTHSHRHRGSGKNWIPVQPAFCSRFFTSPLTRNVVLPPPG